MKKIKFILVVASLLMGIQIAFAQTDSNYYKPGPAEYNNSGNVNIDPAQNTMQMYNNTMPNTQQNQYGNTNPIPNNNPVDFNNNTNINPANNSATNPNSVNFNNTLPATTTPPPGTPSPTDYSGGINTGNVNNPR
jgi:hypothetical protein